MATIAENIETMADLVAKVKRNTRLTETTIMRIVDMNFALAQQAQTPTFGGDEPFPFEGDDTPEIPEGQLVMFPESDAETAEALGIAPTKED